AVFPFYDKEAHGVALTGQCLKLFFVIGNATIFKIGDTCNLHIPACNLCLETNAGDVADVPGLCRFHIFRRALSSMPAASGWLELCSIPAMKPSTSSSVCSSVKLS